jgi:hypothetical protein
VPATVSGECACIDVTDFERLGRRQARDDPQARRPAITVVLSGGGANASLDGIFRCNDKSNVKLAGDVARRNGKLQDD